MQAPSTITYDTIKNFKKCYRERVQCKQALSVVSDNFNACLNNVELFYFKNIQNDDSDIQKLKNIINCLQLVEEENKEEDEKKEEEEEEKKESIEEINLEEMVKSEEKQKFQKLKEMLDNETNDKEEIIGLWNELVNKSSFKIINLNNIFLDQIIDIVDLIDTEKHQKLSTSIKYILDNKESAMKTNELEEKILSQQTNATSTLKKIKTNSKEREESKQTFIKFFNNPNDKNYKAMLKEALYLGYTTDIETRKKIQNKMSFWKHCYASKQEIMECIGKFIENCKIYRLERMYIIAEQVNNYIANLSKPKLSIKEILNESSKSDRTSYITNRIYHGWYMPVPFKQTKDNIDQKECTFVPKISKKSRELSKCIEKYHYRLPTKSSEFRTAMNPKKPEDKVFLYKKLKKNYAKEYPFKPKRISKGYKNIKSKYMTKNNNHK